MRIDQHLRKQTHRDIRKAVAPRTPRTSFEQGVHLQLPWKLHRWPPANGNSVLSKGTESQNFRAGRAVGDHLAQPPCPVDKKSGASTEVSVRGDTGAVNGAGTSPGQRCPTGARGGPRGLNWLQWAALGGFQTPSKATRHSAPSSNLGLCVKNQKLQIKPFLREREGRARLWGRNKGLEPADLGSRPGHYLPSR